MKVNSIYLIVVIGLIFLSSCSTVNSITGKTELEKKIADLKQQLAESKKTIAELEQQLRSEKAKCAKDLEEMQKKLEMTKVKGMPVILFNGDIIYEVAGDAYADYRAGIRYRSLMDEDFKKALEEFESGKGGDAVMLKVLREIDTSGDKLIDNNEAVRFRKSEENKYTSQKKEENLNY